MRTQLKQANDIFQQVDKLLADNSAISIPENLTKIRAYLVEMGVMRNYLENKSKYIDHDVEKTQSLAKRVKPEFSEVTLNINESNETLINNLLKFEEQMSQVKWAIEILENGKPANFEQKILQEFNRIVEQDNISSLKKISELNKINAVLEKFNIAYTPKLANAFNMYNQSLIEQANKDILEQSREKFRALKIKDFGEDQNNLFGEKQIDALDKPANVKQAEMQSWVDYVEHHNQLTQDIKSLIALAKDNSAQLYSVLAIMLTLIRQALNDNNWHAYTAIWPTLVPLINNNSETVNKLPPELQETVQLCKTIDEDKSFYTKSYNIALQGEHEVIPYIGTFKNQLVVFTSVDRKDKSQNTQKIAEIIAKISGLQNKLNSFATPSQPRTIEEIKKTIADVNQYITSDSIFVQRNTFFLNILNNTQQYQQWFSQYPAMINNQEDKVKVQQNLILFVEELKKQLETAGKLNDFIQLMENKLIPSEQKAEFIRANLSGQFLFDHKKLFSDAYVDWDAYLNNVKKVAASNTDAQSKSVTQNASALKVEDVQDTALGNTQDSKVAQPQPSSPIEANSSANYKDLNAEQWKKYWQAFNENLPENFDFENTMSEAKEQRLAAHQKAINSLHIQIAEKDIIDLDNLAMEAPEGYKEVFQNASRVATKINITDPDSWKIHWKHYDALLSKIDQKSITNEARIAFHQQAIRYPGYSTEDRKAYEGHLAAADEFAWQKADRNNEKYKNYFKSHLQAQLALPKLLNDDIAQMPIRKLKGFSNRTQNLNTKEVTLSLKDGLEAVQAKYGKDFPEIVQGYTKSVNAIIKMLDDYQNLLTQNTSDPLAAAEKFIQMVDENGFKSFINVNYFYDQLSKLEGDQKYAEPKLKSALNQSITIGAVQLLPSTTPGLEELSKIYTKLDNSEQAHRVSKLLEKFKTVIGKSDQYQDNIKILAIEKKNLEGGLTGEILREIGIKTSGVGSAELNESFEIVRKDFQTYLSTNGDVSADDKTKILEHINQTLNQIREKCSSKIDQKSVNSDDVVVMVQNAKAAISFGQELTSDATQFAIQAIKLRVTLEKLSATHPDDEQLQNVYKDFNKYFEDNFAVGVLQKAKIIIKIISQQLPEVETSSYEAIKQKIAEKLANKMADILGTAEQGIDKNLTAFEAIQKGNPAEKISVIDSIEWKIICEARPKLNNISLEQANEKYWSYLKLKSILKNESISLTEGKFIKKISKTGENGKLEIVPVVINETLWTELQSKNPELLANISIENAKDIYAFGSELGRDFGLVNGSLVKKEPNREQEYITQVRESNDQDVIASREILSLIDRIQAYKNYKIPEKLSGFAEDDQKTAYGLLVSIPDDIASAHCVEQTYNDLIKLLSKEKLLDEELYKLLVSEKNEFLTLGRILNNAFEVKAGEYQQTAQLLQAAKNIDNQDLSSAFLDGNQYKLVSPKQGGANSAGEKGGIYQHHASGKKVLFKQDPHHTKNMAEFLAGQLNKKLIGDQSATIMLATTRPEGKNDLKSNGSDVYVGSVLIPHYQEDFYKYAYRKAGEEVPANRPVLTGYMNEGPVQQAFMSFNETKNIRLKQEFANIAAVNLLLGNFDLHSGNIGIAKIDPTKGDDESNLRLVTFDFGAAFNGLERDIHPHSHSRHLPIIGPTNHFRDYPREIRISREMADAIEHVSNQDLSDVYNKALDEMAQFYGYQPLKEFAERLGVNANQYPVDDKKALLNGIKTYMKELLDARQQSLREFGLEIRIDLMIDASIDQTVKHTGTNFSADQINEEILQINLKQLVEESEYNRDYILKRLVDRKFHFRAANHKGDFIERHLTHTTEKALIEKITTAANVIFKTDKKAQAELIKAEELNQIAKDAENIVSVKEFNAIIDRLEPYYLVMGNNSDTLYQLRKDIQQNFVENVLGNKSRSLTDALVDNALTILPEVVSDKLFGKKARSSISQVLLGDGSVEAVKDFFDFLSKTKGANQKELNEALAPYRALEQFKNINNEVLHAAIVNMLIGKISKNESSEFNLKVTPEIIEKINALFTKEAVMPADFTEKYKQFLGIVKDVPLLNTLKPALDAAFISQQGQMPLVNIDAQGISKKVEAVEQESSIIVQKLKQVTTINADLQKNIKNVYDNINELKAGIKNSLKPLNKYKQKLRDAINFILPLDKEKATAIQETAKSVEQTSEELSQQVVKLDQAGKKISHQIQLGLHRAHETNNTSNQLEGTVTSSLTHEKKLTIHPGASASSQSIIKPQVFIETSSANQDIVFIPYPMNNQKLPEEKMYFSTSATGIEGFVPDTRLADQVAIEKMVKSMIDQAIQLYGAQKIEDLTFTSANPKVSQLAKQYATERLENIAKLAEIPIQSTAQKNEVHSDNLQATAPAA